VGGETDGPCCRCSEDIADGEGEMRYGQTVNLRIPKKTREGEGRVTIKVYLRSIDLYEARVAASAGIDKTRKERKCVPLQPVREKACEVVAPN
jgi:hypothetical protein